MVIMQHCMIVWLMWDTIYVIYGFIPISSTGTVSTVTGVVMKMGTHGIPVIHPSRIEGNKISTSCRSLHAEVRASGPLQL